MSKRTNTTLSGALDVAWANGWNAAVAAGRDEVIKLKGQLADVRSEMALLQKRIRGFQRRKGHRWTGMAKR